MFRFTSSIFITWCYILLYRSHFDKHTFPAKSVSTLPCVSTINRIGGDQRASISYMEESLFCSTTLQSDENRKHGDVYEV